MFKRRGVDRLRHGKLIDEVMLRGRELFRRRLGCANGHSLIALPGIGRDDGGAQPLRQLNGKTRLSGCRRPGDDNKCFEHSSTWHCQDLSAAGNSVPKRAGPYSSPLSVKLSSALSEPDSPSLPK